MHRMKHLTFLLLFLMAVVLASPATSQAQDYFRLDTAVLDGEPTDLEDTLQLLGEGTLGDNDISDTPPADEEELDSWWQQVLNVLRELGLIRESD